MKALISGQAGLAVLFDGDRIYSLDCEDGHETPREESDISYLFADTTDVAELVHTSREVVVEALDLARRKDEALHLFVILLDRDADKEARGLAAECLEELTGDLRVFDSIANRLYAAPLPDNADLVGALIHADRVQALHLAGFLDELGLHQPDVRRWRAAWDALSFDFFPKPGMKDEFGYRLVTSGALRKLVQSDPKGIDGLLYQCLIDPELQSLPDHRRILMNLVGPFRLVKKNIHFEPESDQEDIARPSRPRRGAEKLKRSSIVFETINEQKEAIKRLLSDGNTRRAFKYVDDLVKFQEDRSEIQDLAKSLCDLAQHAKNIGDHEVQLSLAQRAVEILPTDGWSQAQLGDAFLCLGKHEEALAAYGAARDCGSVPVARCGRAEVLKALGRQEEALEEYESAARDFPQEVVARCGRAEALKALGRLEEALEEYESAARDFPQEVVARNGRAEVLKALGRLEEALEEYESAAREFPHDVVARNGRAEVLKALGRLDEALNEYESTARDFPRDVVARCGRAEVLKALGRLEEALNEYESAARDFPHSVVARNGRAEVLKALGRLEEALNEYESAARDFPHSVVARNGRAEVLKALGRLEEALEECESAAREFPHDVVARCGRAEVLKGLGRLDEALEEYDSAAREFPHDVVARNGRAEVLKALGRLDEALNEYESAAREFPHDVVARCGRAAVLKALGRLKEALSEYESAARDFPHSVVARNGRAEVLKALGRLEEALEEYETAAREFPRDVVARCGRAEVLKALGRLEEALEEYESVTRDFPHDVVARCGKASVLALLGRYQEALELISSGSPRTFAEWVAYHIRGMVLLKQGHLDSAIEILERGARQNPWVFHRVYFQTGLAVARLRRREFEKAAAVVGADPAPLCDALRIHAYGGLGDIEKAEDALNRIKDSRLPKLVLLRDELAATYLHHLGLRSQRSDTWIFEQECDLLLAA